MSKILCTGGCGFIGSHVIEKLLAANHEVWCVDDLSTGKRENLPKGADFGEVDITKWFDIVSEFVDFEPEYVIHLAAQPSLCDSVDNPIKDAHINVMGTLNILRCAQKIGAKRVIMASTSAVYGDRDEEWETEGWTEDHYLAPSSPYGISKMAAECYVMQLPLPDRSIVLRLGNVFGPRQVPIGENQVIPRMIQHFESGKPFYIHGDGEQKRDFVYVEDVADAFVKSLDGNPGIYNIGTGKSISVNEIAREIETLYNVKGYTWEHDAQADNRNDIRLNSKPAFAGLGWSAKYDFAEGLKRTVEWWKTK